MTTPRSTPLPARLVIFLSLVAALVWEVRAARAQGCVVARQSAPVPGAQTSPYLQPGDWQFSGGVRHFISDRHFIGTREDAERTARGSQDINTVFLFDLELTRAILPRLSLSVGLPYLMAERSSPIYSPDLMTVTDRNRTSARGIGDMVITARTWLFDPARHLSGNVALGLGLKLPTGVANAHDSFRQLGGQTQVRTVDPSIQPGDGGFGLVIGLSAFRRIAPASLYASGTYLVNPRATNGVYTYRSRPGETFLSVPDQYILRAGAFVSVPRISGLAFGLGGRIEGTMAHDLVGGDDGFRRPGYALSVEPAASYVLGRWELSASIPVALLRNREVSPADEQDMQHGDAAFADYALQLGVSYRFGKPATRAARAPVGAPADPPGTARAADILPRGLVDLDERPTLPRLGARLTVVNLWASWCKPCAAEVPMLSALATRLEPHGVSFIGISVDSAVADARAGAAALGFTFPVLFGGVDYLFECQESQVPTTLLLDAGGRIVDRVSGQVSERVLREMIDRALGEPLPEPLPDPPLEPPAPAPPEPSPEPSTEPIATGHELLAPGTHP